MKANFLKRTLSMALVICLVAIAIVAAVTTVSADTKTYTMTADEITTFAQGAKADGDSEAVGTEQYFDVFYSAKTKVDDGSAKTFEDATAITNRISWGGNTSISDTVKNAIRIQTEGAASVKIWFVSGGDGREIGIYDAQQNVVTQTNLGTVKNGLYIATLSLDVAGTYYIGNVGGSNNYYKIEVTETVETAKEVTYTLDATADLAAMSAGAKNVGDFDKAGTDNFFIIHYSEKTKIDGSNKNFDDGYSATQRINMGGSTATNPLKNAIEFTTEGPSVVKVWWVSGGDGRALELIGAEGKVLESRETASVKNSLYISTFEIEEAGKYYLGSTAGSNYYFKISVTVMSGGAPSKPPRADWASVAAPVINSATDMGDGSVEVNVSALVGYDGADEVTVTMYNANGDEVATKRSIAEKGEHTLVFEPIASGTYTFKATILREGEESKQGAEGISAAFVYPLGAPVIISVTSKGNGTLEVVFTAVPEATGYEVVIGGVSVADTTETVATVTGLTVGEKVEVFVKAIRGEESKTSQKSVSVTVTQEAKTTWGFTVYGPSTSLSTNGYEGSLNEDGNVTVYSEGGKGKIQPTSVDGIAFYYTTVSTDYNFTLRAKVTVDSWTFSNGQEGFGLMATDRIGISGNASDFWNNSYLIGSTKIEYRYDAEADKTYDIADPAAESFPKYSMKQGLGIIERTGVTSDNLALFEANDTTTIQNYFKTISKTLETIAGESAEAGTYNVIGNYTGNAPAGTLDEAKLLTTFVLEIQKNNTGYFLSYYDTEGNLIQREKFYDTDALNKIDSENVYVGFFASRNARATFSDVQFSTILATEDAPAEERPITYITPTVSISSPTVTTDLDYALWVDTNVNGTLKVTLNGNVLAEGSEVVGLVRYILETNFGGYGEHELVVTFTPDPEQDLGEYTQLSTTDNQSISVTIYVNKGFYHNKTVYVAPNGAPNGNGTPEYPLDIYTAIDNVVPGQTIVIMEGTYLLSKTVKIQRGMDGTAQEPIKMVADPDAKTRPVFDFQGLVAGFVHGGDYWYFYGFDVTRSANMQKGFQVSGNYNTLDQINTYYNGNTGIQISRYSGSDLFPDWPAYNLILNCTSYCNYDLGFEDADGFAAKLTCGEGNVFDGCIAYNNADDGWDLYAKVETGSIGAVTIQNCVAYANGFVPGIPGKTGNGNGFKLGGSSLSGKHKLINSYAFYNLAKGIDSNSCPDVIVEDCTSYNNGSYNVAFYTNAGANTAFAASGIISFKDSDLVNHLPSGVLDRAEQLKGKGTQVADAYINATTYYWYGTECRNAQGTVITPANIFTSLVFTEITRNDNGTINMNGFLELNENAPADAGARASGQASEDNSTLPEGDDHNFSEDWVIIDSELHWHECECGFRSELGKHEYEYIIETMPTETTSGWKYRECKVCGKRGAKIEIYYDEIAPGTGDGNENNSGTENEGDNGGNAGTIAIIVVASVIVLAGIAVLVFKFVIPKIKK